MPTPYRAPKLHAMGMQVAKPRYEKGWSIDRLTEESGVGRRTIINLERAIKTPRIDTLYAIAAALDVPLAELVDELQGSTFHPQPDQWSRFATELTDPFDVRRVPRSGLSMTTETPSWWHDRDHLYTVLRDLLKHLRRRASTFDTRTEGWLLLSGIHLGRGPWRYVEEVDVVGELPFETGLVLVNEMLARLQELTWEEQGRAVIGHAHDRISQIFNPDELDWLRPDDSDHSDDV